MRNIVAACIFVLVLSGCGMNATSTARTTPIPTPDRTKSAGYVSREMLGADWPFTFSDGVLSCGTAQAVTLNGGGSVYALNLPALGQAEDHSWKDGNAAAKGKKLYALIDRGLKLCP